MRPDTSAPVSSDTLAVVDPSLRALLITHQLGADVSGLAMPVGETLVVEPQADGTLAEMRDRDFDVAVVAVNASDLTRTVASLQAAGRLLKVGGRLALELSDSVPDADPAEWASAFREFSLQSFERTDTGLLMWLVPSDGQDLRTGPLALGAMLSAGGGPRASLAQAHALTTQVVDRARALEAEVAQLHDENVRLTSQVSKLQGSRAVRWSAGYRRARSQGLSGWRGRRLAVAAAVIVGLVLACAGLIGALTWLTDSLGIALAAAASLVVVALMAVRAEVRGRRTARRLAAMDAGMREEIRSRRSFAAATRRASQASAKSEKRARRAAAKDLRVQYEQIQAIINLFALTKVDAPVPPLRGWAVSPDALLLLVGELLACRPALVVECGSGSSTLWLALAAKQHGLTTSIVALEHDPAFKRQTEQLLERHGVADLAHVRLAPLVRSTLTDHETPWYDQAALDDLTDIGLLFIDGPPEATGRLARYPALPLLFDRLAPDAVVILDDAGREDERTAVATWLDAYPALRGEHVQSEKGTAILRRGRL